jgi:hypothetical protein
MIDYTYKGRGSERNTILPALFNQTTEERSTVKPSLLLGRGGVRLELDGVIPL